MQNDEIAPVDHGFLSSTGTVAVEAGKKGILWGLLSGPTVGAILGAGIAALCNIGAITGAASLSAAGGALASGVGSVAFWGLVGGGAGFVAMFVPFVAPLLIGVGAAIGISRGFSTGSDRVSKERGAANVLQAQVSAMQAQAAAMGQMADNYAPSPVMKDYNLPASGTQFNSAPPSGLQAGNDNMQYVGRVDGAQLASARG